MTVLRLFVRQFSAAAQKGAKPDPRLHYDFIPATQKDLGKMVDLCCSDFIKVEPHSRALGLTDKDTRYLFEYIIEKSLHYPYCLTVVEKTTGRLIGLRAVSMGHRDHSLDWEPFKLENGKLSENVVKLAAVLDASKAAFWKVADPSITKVMRREISFIVADHQRKGIAKTMVELNFDYDQMRADGIQGILSEASSLANQTLLQNAGYKFLCEPEKYDWATNMDDGTTGIKVFFKDLRVKSQ